MSPRNKSGPKLTRLISMLMLLAAKGTMSVDDLARRFHVDTDELISDLELAACCGIPPYTPDSLLEIVVDGDIVYVTPGQELIRKRRVSVRDALEFILAARVMQELPGLEDNDIIASVVNKLEKAGNMAAIKAHLEQPPESIETVRQALDRGLQLEIYYYSFSRDAMSRRVVDPVSLSSIGGQWYLDTYCHLANAPRRFRVSRIHEAIILDTKVCNGLHSLEPSKPFSTASTFVGFSPDATVVTLKIDAKVMPIVEALPLESIERDGDGAIVTMHSSGKVFLERLLMQLAGYGELLDPPELATLGRECAVRTLKRYIMK